MISENMTGNFFKKAAIWLSENGNIQEKYIDLYAKAMETLLAVVINFATALLIGWLCGMWWHCVILLAAFIPLRSYAGGYHAKGYISCYFESCGLLAAALLIIKYFAISGKMVSEFWQLFVISVVVVFMLSPMADKNKPISEKEAKVFKKRARTILIAEVIIALILAWLQVDYGYSVMMAIPLSAFVLVLRKCTGYLNLLCRQVDN